MVALIDLWLPILLAAVFVFIASSIIHMATPLHKSDSGKLADEDRLLEAVRAQGAAPGEYMFPRPASMKDMCSPEMTAKFQAGPVGFLTLVPPGPPGMGKSLAQWFGFCLVISFFVAYIAKLGLAAGTPYGHVFRVTGTIAILGYAFSNVQNSIWKGAPWGVTAKFVFDGVVYGLVTAGTFGWLWP